MLPLLIFLAELTVVTLSTLRIIFLSRGHKYLAPFLGLFEITIWLFAIGQIMQNLTNVGCYIAFAAGFTVGNFLGVLIEQRMAIGHLLVRVITHKNAAPLLDDFKDTGYGVTCIDAMGATGPVQVIFTVVKRRDLDHVVSIIKRFDWSAFYSVDDLQSATQGVFPAQRTPTLISPRAWKATVSASRHH